MMDLKDIPSPIDLRNSQDALEWAMEVNIKRPWRYDFFQKYVDVIAQKQAVDILEIGSGPGFFADFLLKKNLNIRYNAFDFSEAMHELSKSKLLSSDLSRCQFYLGDFKQAGWDHPLAQYDVIVIHQALHELRHKDYAENFHQQVAKHLKAEGLYIVCDHLVAEGAMTNDQLYMSKDEHFTALKNAGFQTEIMYEYQGLCAFQCTQI